MTDMTNGFSPPVALTIAGSDPGGGAGIQADLRTFAAHGVHGCTAIAALTAQNTYEVRRVVATDPGFLREQIEAVLDDLPVVAVKTGMLSTVANIRVVAELAAAGRLPNLVVDPVMVSSSDDRLLDEEAERAYLDELFPHALVVTPNGREAAALLGIEFEPGQQQLATGGPLIGTGARFAVVTGGDVADLDAVDTITWDPTGGATHADATPVHLTWRGGRRDVLVWELRTPRIPTRNTHGTGCSFASAIAAGLARGTGPLDAIAAAKAFVHDAIVRSADWKLGAGHGPIDHLDLIHPLIERAPARLTDRKTT